MSLKVSDIGGAVSSLRRAVELIPADQTEHWDAVVKLTEIYLAVARGEKQYMDEVEKSVGELLKHDPNSFDGHRLLGDLNYSKATVAYKDKKIGEGQAFLDAAGAEYRKADALKPAQQALPRVPMVDIEFLARSIAGDVKPCQSHLDHH